MMKRDRMKIILVALSFLYPSFFMPTALLADASRYPQFAQHQLPKGLVPEFVYLNQLTDEISAGKKPLIVDVRTVEEYREAHILGSVSIPLEEMPKRLTEIPKNRLIVLY
jgi:hypothetical protein